MTRKLKFRSLVVLFGGMTLAHGVYAAGTQIVPNSSLAGSSACVDDTWAAISTVMAPSPRSDFTAVWTGKEMIVWGGYDGISYLNNGARYNPDTDSWKPINTFDAPSPRAGHTAVWTGKEMIVWGGATCGLRDMYGQRVSSLPTCTHLQTGARYDPTTDSWAPIAIGGLEFPPRTLHTAVWTGTEMIVWGRVNNTGARYDPATDTWRFVRIADAPGTRLWHSAVWTGAEMIIWGGGMGDCYHVTNTGGRYQPNTDTWNPTSTPPYAPIAREFHTAVWTGQGMIVWGGQYPLKTCGSANTGNIYDPATDTWGGTALTGAPTSRTLHSAIWTGTEMIIWGGFGYGSSVDTGGRYNVSTNTWAATSLVNAPSARQVHTAIWTGTEMIVWGGVHNYWDPVRFEHLSDYLNTGGRYCARR